MPLARVRLLGAPVCCVLALLPLGSGCGKHGVGTPGGGTHVPPSKVVLHRNVELANVEQRSLVYRVDTVGMLEAEGQTDIAAGVSGVVDQVYFREGDEVQPGSLLISIDQVRFQADDELARANVERAKAALELARDLAERAIRAGQGTSEEERARARGQLRVAEAEHRSTIAALARARNNLDRSRVRAPYHGRINKRFITKGSYLEEKTTIATIADLSRIRLVGYVPETAAPIVRELLRHQDQRLDAARLGLLLAGGQGSHPLPAASSAYLVGRDFLLSGYDPEFELLAFPGQQFFARIFYMSTVANADTHMFEAKAEVLGLPVPMFSPEPKPLPVASADDASPVGLNGAAPLPPRLEFPLPKKGQDTRSDTKLWPGFTAKIRFPLRSNPNASVIPEEAVRASERGFIAFVPKKQIREDGQTEWIAKARTLELGFRAEGWVEVRNGLDFGESVVRRGAEALEDGTPIRFQVAPK